MEHYENSGNDIQLQFNYNALEPSDATILQTYAGEIKVFMTKTLENILEVGKRLKDVREILADNKHGGFEAWIRAEFDWSRRTAYNFISVYEELGNRATVARLDGIPLKALYMLAAPATPDAIRQDVIDRAEAGETMSCITVKHLVEQAKQQPAVKDIVTETARHFRHEERKKEQRQQQYVQQGENMHIENITILEGNIFDRINDIPDNSYSIAAFVIVPAFVKNGL